MSSKVKGGNHRALTADMSKLASSRSESEKDCGFSDTSSGYLSAVEQTDSEDASRVSAVRSSQSGPPVAVMAGPYPSLSPMIIMNNVVLKQPNATAPAVKPWGFQPALEVLPQPQVVFLQPVVSTADRASTKRAPSKQRTRKYLPILKSYPKIAPYPGESLSDKSKPSSSERSVSAPSHGVGRHRRRHHRDKQPGHVADCGGSAKPAPPAAASPGPAGPKRNLAATDVKEAGVQVSVKPPSAAQPQALIQSSAAPPSPSPEAGCVDNIASPCKRPAMQDQSTEACWDVPADGTDKRKRFCNTYNILQRSGLLGITLRTKELIRLNRRTQGQLERLREHTGLFLQAVSSGDPQVWAKLQLTMLEAPPSGSEEEQVEGLLEKTAQDSHA
ncbi:CLOCK-interacting pacemaker a [Brienomyrus brachyistius]|uniref:CLOCK-interacting pacemaker a n=1 Tax=Brienomyrus brachyistius TaxID=42636 RepID=UPI0020B2B9BD|nr:CLOCK-interacting pacemaker a [Brienomyrus brachyistius]XP_048831212.1 CLOCK-interacting pacemaker a [Brienomyrus brachyistius]XP_048831213.1 CLOCK-interacting pacemaker a [Brienomyrus brachyistius]XP_048831214.1 CLOCK-interacting pacemaker a [Brienomyrus brachyistius]